MRKLLIGLALVALAAPATALAGGWATAGLEPPPDDIGAGDTWNANITILQHGQTPLDGVTPAVTIRKGGVSKTFTARPAGEPGKYVANVVFPSEGRWEYTVYDGFTQYGGQKTHTFAPVTIGGASGGALSFLALVALVAAGAAVLFALYLLSRRVRVRAPAPAG
jgi:hypothetical protein